jgi:hypothetical protein
VEHGEQNSHLTLAPQAIRDILNRMQNRVSSPETPVVAITSSGARYFLRQMAESALPNLFFLAHNEVPPGLRVQSLGIFRDSPYRKFARLTIGYSCEDCGARRSRESQERMRIKSYYAHAVEDAMSMARQELGPDAMLVNTRKASPEARHLGEYEVVFATDLVKRACALPGYSNAYATLIASDLDPEMAREILEAAEARLIKGAAALRIPSHPDSGGFQRALGEELASRFTVDATLGPKRGHAAHRGSGRPSGWGQDNHSGQAGGELWLGLPAPGPAAFHG